MRFTVFGGQGFIGGELARSLRSAGHEVVIPAGGFFPDTPPSGGYGHAVWAIGLTADFRSRPFDTVEAHVSALAPVLNGGAFESFLYLSSTRVYMRADVTDEDAPLPVASADPSDLYNVSKLCGEALCLARPNTRIARLSNVLGPGEGARDTFIGALCRQAAAGRIRLQSDPASLKDYVWIDDVVTYLAQIALTGRQRIYNVARGSRIRHDAWVAALAAVTGADADCPDGLPETSFLPIETGRLVAEFGPARTDPLDRVDRIAAPSAPTSIL